MSLRLLTLISVSLLLFIAACEDQGDPVTVAGPTPTLVSVSPDSGKTNDTITIVGNNFGTTRGTSIVTFGSVNAGTYISWSGTQIKAVVPSGVTTGNVNIAVTVTGKSSNTKIFKALSPVTLVKFSTDIQPIIASYNCASCHGNGSTFNNFNITTYANLMAGTSSHGPVITPNDGTNSYIVKKLLGTASFGGRMPQSGPPYLSNAEIQKFIEWINQGAINN